MTGISVEQLVAMHPRLYHMAADGSWPSIRKHGLLSTERLLDLFEVTDDERTSILGAVRRNSVVIEHPTHGRALIRDQRPAKFLDRCVTSGTSADDFLAALNSRVFFWLTRERLHGLLTAVAYRRDPQLVLELDTAELLADYADLVELAPYNTGSMHVPTAPIRDASVFQSLPTYPWDDWRQKRGPRQDAVVELTVPGGVPDVMPYLRSVRRWVGGQEAELIYERPSPA